MDLTARAEPPSQLDRIEALLLEIRAAALLLAGGPSPAADSPVTQRGESPFLLDGSPGVAEKQGTFSDTAPALEDAPGATNVPAKDTGAQKRGDRPSADAGGPVAPVSRRKRDTPCPEDLTPEQWLQVAQWRDANRPLFRDAFLLDQWKAHVDHHVGLGSTRANWTRSFCSWLRREYCKPPPAPPREQSEAFVPSGEAPPETTDAEKAEMHERHLKEKRARASRKRRGSGAAADTNQEEAP